MTECLIIAASAHSFAREIESAAEPSLSVAAYTSAEQALEKYNDQSIVFGDPDLIASILPGMPKVDWVQSTWAGVKPLIEIDRRDYVLTGIKDVFGPQMSEYVMGYLLAHELRLLQRIEYQNKRQWRETASGTLQGKRVGIMGTGSIGRHIARTAALFQMEVAGLSRSGAELPEFGEVFSVDRLHDFLQEVDYLVSTLPQTDETDQMLDAEALARLPEGAYFINVGRGNIIDDEALIDALNSEHLAGAALDVFDEEPLPAESPLWDARNIRVTAHIAAVSYPELIVPIFVENYRRYSQKRDLNFVVDFDLGY